MAAAMKNYFDRMFCYYAASFPESEMVQKNLMGKRAVLALSAEESNMSARLGIVHQIQEICRYLHYDLVGVVTGIGNKTGEIVNDPTRPIDSAREIGSRIFRIVQTDYKLDTPRPGRVWGEENESFPAYWR